MFKVSSGTTLKDTSRTYSIFWRICTYTNVFYFSVRKQEHNRPTLQLQQGTVV